jgi:putative membrane protein insertion efficiency factor
MSSTSSHAPCASAPAPTSGAVGPAARIVLAAIRVYQLALSPVLGQHCRFAPSCSAYAAEAIRRYGVLIGSGCALRRLARCHPLCDGGYDPVP